MTDRELLELLLSKVTSMETYIGNIKTELKSISEQTAILTEFKEETNSNFNNISNKLDDIEVNNAERHLDINRDIKDMKSDISRIEMNTADNWRDIARLKHARRHRTK